MFLEGSLIEQLEAEGTGEVFRVPLASHGCHTLACNSWLGQHTISVQVTIMVGPKVSAGGSTAGRTGNGMGRG